MLQKRTTKRQQGFSSHKTPKKIIIATWNVRNIKQMKTLQTDVLRYGLDLTILHGILIIMNNGAARIIFDHLKDFRPIVG